MPTPKQLLVLDIDNTVFDWVSYYVTAMEALLDHVSKITGQSQATLAAEARQVFEAEGSIEYPFLIQQLPSVTRSYPQQVDQMLAEAVEPGRQAFNQAAQRLLKPYPGVEHTLAAIRREWPDMSLVALTDAPRYVAMWKLNKLGILNFFDAVYGLPDPRIPTDPDNHQVMVDQEILIKHLQRRDFDFTGRIRTLPMDYEKPGTKGLKTVLMDYEMEQRQGDILWVGDNLRKDVGLGRQLGVHTAWAEYGTRIADEVKQRLLAFSPLGNVHKNAPLDPQAPDSPEPDDILETFADLRPALGKLFPTT